jgi:hypothetical protein
LEHPEKALRFAFFSIKMSEFDVPLDLFTEPEGFRPASPKPTCIEFARKVEGALMMHWKNMH